ncbi:MAG: DMT family transporter [Hyphomicrobiales bacterium]|nr:DMT family transporter [Hyphomicrobiales bacterium]
MNRAPRPLDRTGILIVVFLCASWGLNQVTAKIAMADISPLMQATLRSLGGAIILGAWAIWRDPNLFASDRTLWPGIAGGVAFGVEFVALFIGLQWTTASHAILFLYSAPFFVALALPWITPSERLSRLQWIGLGLSFLGVGLALKVSSGSRDMLIGDALSLVAGFFWAATTIIMKGSRLRFVRPEKTLLYQLVVSVFVIGGFALWRGEHLPTHLSLLTGAAFAYQTLWIVCLTFAIWFWMVQTYRAGELSAFTFLTPLFGAAAGHFILGDEISLGFAAAVALVAVGILMVNWPTRA